MPDITSLLDVWKFAAGEHKTLWTYFITIVTGVVGFSFSDKFPSMSTQAKAALLAALGVFLLSNVVSLGVNLCIYNAATLELAKQKEKIGSVAAALITTPWHVLLTLHALLDIAAILMVYHRAFRSTGNSKSTPDTLPP